MYLMIKYLLCSCYVFFFPVRPYTGVMCEYDALPGIGHACGHNLIAIMGVSVALGIKEALHNSGVSGKVKCFFHYGSY